MAIGWTRSRSALLLAVAAAVGGGDGGVRDARRRRLRRRWWGFQIQYCEEDHRGQLNESRCYDEPDGDR